MEEVDKIIIESLRNLHCDIDEDISSLKQFDSDMLMLAIATCLEAMNSHIKLPRKFPPSMSARIKYALNLAQQIKEFGFKGDIGYQTILYCNEVEVRRVLMFLLERLPKEPGPVALIEPMGYVPRIVEQIEKSLKLSLGQMWLPVEVLDKGLRINNQGMFVNSFGYNSTIDWIKLLVPHENNSSSEFEAYIPWITQQCSSKQLIPSLLFQSSSAEFPSSDDEKLKQFISYLSNTVSSETLDEIAENPDKTTDVSMSNDGSNNQIKIENLLAIVKQKKENLLCLQRDVSGEEERLLELKIQREKKENELKETEERAKIKRKTLAILSSDENKAKLKNLIQKAERRFVDLSEQWNDVQTPLLEEHKTLKSSISSDGLKYHNEQTKLQNLKKTYKNLVIDFKQKCVLEENLMEECKELNQKNNRAAYTKRILEIVGNIKKQNKEIQKILADTRQVQKDIHNLTGQLDRSFTLCDEIIFHDCKRDESARRAYKYLAALREECDGILQAVSDMGQSERELRNLEEQIEIEKSKNVNEKLEKVQSDLTEIKKEIQLLL
ncbi:coiled-coil domain-containing protein 22 homolog [Euwallacea similis]|uniref:coiled-coil domain-containing protein 22 homolog n=1 Tax=Euwallacea similis TaxID=1736056 RepID=UPI00344F5CB1